MRIIVAGWLRFDGGDVCAQVVRGGAQLIAESRSEQGCVAYNWSVDPLEEGLMHVYEEWESERDLLRHFRHSSYLEMRGHLESFQLSAFDIKLYSVAGTEPVYTDTGEPRSTLFGVSLD